jgi:hypothetical protein
MVRTSRSPIRPSPMVAASNSAPPSRRRNRIGVSRPSGSRSSPGPAHTFLEVDRRARHSCRHIRHRHRRPVAALETFEQRRRDEARARRIQMPVAVAPLPVHQELLRHAHAGSGPRRSPGRTAMSSTRDGYGAGCVNSGCCPVCAACVSTCRQGRRGVVTKLPAM